MIEAPHSKDFDDIYFAAEDGLAESRYVFLKQNHLPEAWLNREHFVIAETGFGTGLNFLCAWDLFEKTTISSQELHYYSFEKYPLSASDIAKYLGHWADQFDGKLQQLVGRYPLRVGGWHTLRLTDRVTLTLIFDDVNRTLPELDVPVDCWFLDGHALAKNPEMWSDVVFQNMGRLSVAGSRVSTFTAAGFVRRGLAKAGFRVSKAKGFGRKCDMSVGVFEAAGLSDKKPYPSRLFKRCIAVIGAGIAGATLVNALSQRGCQVTVFEARGIASGGSGNARGLCNPRLTALRAAEADFYASAFAMAHRLFQSISLEDDIGYRSCGSLHVVTDSQKEKRYQGFIDHWGWHEDHARMVSAAEASEIAGISLAAPALFLPDAGVVSPKRVTEYFIQSAVVVYTDIHVICALDNGRWRVDDREFDAVVLAGGFDVGRFSQVAGLPLQKVRGQITCIRPNAEYHKLKTNLCYGGYASIACDGQAVIGSTFQHWIDDVALRPEDDIDNIAKLRQVAPQLVDGIDILGARASFRCASKDRAPVIGAVPGYQGLYLSTAHGSHGILSSLMGADILAADICGSGQVCPRSVERFISPARFL